MRPFTYAPSATAMRGPLRSPVTTAPGPSSIEVRARRSPSTLPSTTIASASRSATTTPVAPTQTEAPASTVPATRPSIRADFGSTSSPSNAISGPSARSISGSDIAEQHARDPFEILGAEVLDLDPPAVGDAFDAHARLEPLAERIRDALEMGILA